MYSYLDIRNISKSFDGTKAVDDLSLKIGPRKITAIIGPNGAGKTTFFNLCTGFIHPDCGSIVFGNKDITHIPPHNMVTLGIARTFQDLRLARQMTVLDNVLLARKNQSGEGLWHAMLSRHSALEQRLNLLSAKETLSFVGLADKASDLAEALSYGQQKLLSIACCLATGAELLMLDEPVAGIAPETTDMLIEYILRLPLMEKTVLMIEHNLAVVEATADIVVVMDRGRKIAEGDWATVSKEANVLEAYIA